MRRNWIKLYVDQILRGTMIDELKNKERWSWIGLLLLAGDSPTEGTVCITNEIGYTDEQLCKLLDVPFEIFKDAKKKMIKFNKIEIDEKNVIKIVKWNKYQSEYKRQRKYRNSYNQKLQPKVTSNSNTLEGRRKKEEGIKKKGENNKDINPENINDEFEQFWKGYRMMGNPKNEIGDKQDAKKAYKSLRKKIPKEEILKAFHGEADYLKYERLDNNFDKKKKYASTWLRLDRWKKHIDFKYSPPL